MDVGWEAGQLHVRSCNVDSDLAQFAMEGDLDLRSLVQGGSAALLAENDCRLQGRLNLAQLAAQLPQLLRLRDDTQVTAGELVVDLTARTAQQVHLVLGNRLIDPWSTPIRESTKGFGNLRRHLIGVVGHNHRTRIDNAGVQTVMSNSFGFGGTNATLVFQKR